MSCIEPDRNDQGREVLKNYRRLYELCCQRKGDVLVSDRHYVPTDLLARTINVLEEEFFLLTSWKDNADT